MGLIREKSSAQGAAALDQALALWPGFASALAARGSAKIGLARYADAIRDYEAARKADPSMAAPLYGLAEAHRGLGETQQAADFYRQYAASNAADATEAMKKQALERAASLPR